MRRRPLGRRRRAGALSVACDGVRRVLTLRRAPGLVAEAPAPRRGPAGRRRPPRRCAAGARRPRHRQDHDGRSRPSSTGSSATARDARPGAWSLTSSRVGRRRACASGSPRGSAAPRPSRSPAPTRPSGSASCARRRPCAATRPRGCSAAPSRTSSCASCWPGTRPARAGRRPGPSRVHAALGTRGFRTELRDLLMRAVERGLEPDDLARLGREHDRPEWVAAAQVLAEYDEVTAFSAPGRLRPGAGSSAPRPTCSRRTRRRARAGARLPALRRRRRRPGADLGRGPAAARRGRARRSTWCCSATPTRAVADLPRRRPAAARRSAWTALGEGADAGAARGAPPAGPAARRSADRVAAADRCGRCGRSPRAAPTAGRAGPGRRAPAARDVPGGGATSRPSCARRTCSSGVPWSRDGGHRARQGRTAHAAPGADGRRGAGGTCRPPRCPCATRWRSRPLLALLDVVLRAALGGARRRSTPRSPSTSLLVPDRWCRRGRRCAGCAGRCAGEELDGGGGRTSDELLVRGARCTADFCAAVGPEAAPARRVARALAAGVEAAARRRDAGRDGACAGRPGSPPRRCCGRCGQATGLGPTWRAAALGGRPGGGARRPRPRRRRRRCSTPPPASSTGCRRPGRRGFLDHLRGQDVAGDTLVARAPGDDAVALLTPQGAAGREWAPRRRGRGPGGRLARPAAARVAARAPSGWSTS